MDVGECDGSTTADADADANTEVAVASAAKATNDDGGGRRTVRFSEDNVLHVASPLLADDDDDADPSMITADDVLHEGQELNARTTGSSSDSSSSSRSKRRWCSWCRRSGESASPTSASTQRHYSLATDPASPRFAAALISILALLTHVLFAYGQIAPMWRLRLNAQIDVWANATTTLSRRTFDAIGLNHTEHVLFDYNDDVSTFTYGFAIKQLWIAAGLPNKFMSRLAAVLLVLFSGVWPHLKLLLLHMTVRMPYGPDRCRNRTASLYWLSTFGKWTLADVFVVCALIGIVALNWTVDPMAVRDGISDELPTLVLVAKSMYSTSEACTQMLGFDCTGDDIPFFHKTKCWTCEAAVNEAYNHPDWARGAGRQVLKGVETDGGGEVELSVAGMRGIYPFCAAAIFSLLLGVLVDVLDHKARRRQASCQASSALSRRPLWSSLAQDDDDFDEDYALGPDAEDAAWLTPSNRARSSGNRRCVLLQQRGVPADTWCQSVTSWIGYGALVVASLFSAFLVYLGCTVPTMEREVIGAGPKVLEDVLGIAWERPYSLQSLVAVSGAEGGTDYLLMGTFAIFVLVGPILRSALCVINLLLPMTASCHEFFATLINVSGAFCAWEVFAIAVYMVDDLIPSVTNTIIHKPICDELSPDTNSCLMIEFNILQSFAGLLVVGGILLVLVSIVSVRLGFSAVDPYKDGDIGGPYFKELCPCRSRKSETVCQEGEDGGVNEEEAAYNLLQEDDMASETDILL
mmetsp:Transcript_1214/g.2541  ORF Transcript_1214/g.2541 Transcript_1214/m.2541 type:complete len:748 (-) Transcript_1214:68-2311(-)